MHRLLMTDSAYCTLAHLIASSGKTGSAHMLLEITPHNYNFAFWTLDLIVIVTKSLVQLPLRPEDGNGHT